MPCRDLQPVAESLFSRFSGKLCEKLDDGGWSRVMCGDVAAELYRVRLDLSRLDEEWVPLGNRAHGMVGALALATKEAPGMQVSVGIGALPASPKNRPGRYGEKEAGGASRTP